MQAAQNKIETNDLKNILNFKTMVFVIKKYFSIKYLVLAIISIVVLTSCIFVYKVSSFGTNSQSDIFNKKQNEILRSLNEINTEITALSNNPSASKEAQLKLQSIEKNIADIHQAVIEVAKTSDIQRVSSQLDSVKDDVDTQMNDIKKTMAQTMGNKEYVEASTLPFKVLSVDVIAGEPYVSVDFENHMYPMSVSDNLAGWRLIVADYDSGVAEFINDKKQYAKIDFQG